MVFLEASVAMNQVGKIKQIAELLEFIFFSIPEELSQY